MANTDRTLVIENATLIFRNFAGLEGKYNRKGDRNFCVLLDPHLAERLHAAGWNIKTLRVREEGDIPQAYVHVAVSYDKGRPPKITMVTESTKSKTPIEEDMCDLLDIIDVKVVDLILNPYSWSVNGATGVKAYLKTMYVVLNEDYLDLKYADLDELPTRSGNVIEASPSWVDGEVLDDIPWEPLKAIGA